MYAARYGVETKNVTKSASDRTTRIQHAERVVPVGMRRDQVVVQQPSNEQPRQETDR